MMQRSENEGCRSDARAHQASSAHRFAHCDAILPQTPQHRDCIGDVAKIVGSGRISCRRCRARDRVRPSQVEQRQMPRHMKREIVALGPCRARLAPAIRCRSRAFPASVNVTDCMRPQASVGSSSTAARPVAPPPTNGLSPPDRRHGSRAESRIRAATTTIPEGPCWSQPAFLGVAAHEPQSVRELEREQIAGWSPRCWSRPAAASRMRPPAASSSDDERAFAFASAAFFQRLPRKLEILPSRSYRLGLCEQNARKTPLSARAAVMSGSTRAPGSAQDLPLAGGKRTLDHRRFIGRRRPSALWIQCAPGNSR